MATRNPVRVLPEPVGEATSTSRPSAMCGQAADCGGVGPAGKRRANQLATAGWKRASGPMESGPVETGWASGTPLFHQDPVTAAQAGTRRYTSGGRPAAPAGD